MQNISIIINKITCCQIASARAAETLREDALINDPFAQYLSNNIEIDQIAPNFDINNIDSHNDGLAVRSRVIDDAILDGIKNGFKQIVVFGAGLDTRPWRLHLQTNANDINNE